MRILFPPKGLAMDPEDPHRVYRLHVSEPLFLIREVLKNYESSCKTWQLCLQRFRLDMEVTKRFIAASYWNA